MSHPLGLYFHIKIPSLITSLGITIKKMISLSWDSLYLERQCYWNRTQTSLWAAVTPVFHALSENMFSEDSDMMVVAISGTGLGCRLKKLRSFLPYVNDIYVPKQFQTAEYKNRLVW